MKKLNVVAIILLALSLAMPATFSFASPKKSSDQAAVLTSKININTADTKALTAVPGIGPKTAESIVDYRKKNGKFNKVDDLLSVKGIGEKTLKKMEKHLTI